MFFKFLYNIYILRENMMQTTPTEREILCLKAAYISPLTPRIFSHTLDILRGINFTSREFLLIAPC